MLCLGVMAVRLGWLGFMLLLSHDNPARSTVNVRWTQWRGMFSPPQRLFVMQGIGQIGSSTLVLGSSQTLISIPEPSTYLVALGLLALCASPLLRRKGVRVS